MNEELKKELAALLEDFKGKVPTNEQIKSLSDKIAQLENSKNDEEVKALRDEIEQLKKAAREQGEKMVILEKSKSAENRKSIDDLFKSDKGKELLAGVKGKTGQAEFEVKDAANITTANVSGDTGPLLSLLGVAGDVYYIKPAIGDSILNAVTVENTDKAAITWVDEVADESAVATVAEGGQKPQLDIKFEEKTSNAIKKAGMVKVTEEAIDDISYMSGAINRALNEKLRDAIETDVIDGIIGIATPYKITDYNGKVEKASMIDAINAQFIKRCCCILVNEFESIVFFECRNTLQTGGIRIVYDHHLVTRFQ